MADELSQSEIERLLGEIGDEDSPDSSSASQDGRGGAAQSARSENGSDPAAGEALSGSGTLEGPVVMPLSRRRIAALLGRKSVASYEPYDFRRSDKLSKDHVRALQAIHENFTRLFTSTLTGYLRTNIQVELISIEQVQYQEYIRPLGATFINVLDVDALAGQALLDFDLRLMFSLFDRLLGGAGEAKVKAGKDLTDVEKLLTSSITRRALDDLHSAWKEVLPLDFEVSSVETSAQFLQLIPDTDTIVLILFDIIMGKQRGAMCLGIPYLLLKPVADKLKVQRWVASARRSNGQLAPKMASRLRSQTTLPCIARLGTSAISVETIATMTPGQIVPLKIAQGNPDDSARTGSLAAVDLIVGGRPKFRGQIGLRGGKRLAVQIDGIITPPPPLEVHKDSAQQAAAAKASPKERGTKRQTVDL